MSDTRKKKNIDKFQKRYNKAQQDSLRTNTKKISSVKEMLVELKWPTLKDLGKAATITMLQVITIGTVKVACDDLQQLPLPARAQRGQKIHVYTSNESPVEQTTETTAPPLPPTTRDLNNLQLPPDEDPAPQPMTTQDLPWEWEPGSSSSTMQESVHGN